MPARSLEEIRKDFINIVGEEYVVKIERNDDTESLYVLEKKRRMFGLRAGTEVARVTRGCKAGYQRELISSSYSNISKLDVKVLENVALHGIN